MGTDENNKKTTNTPQQIKNLGMMMKTNLGMMMKTKQSALKRMTMTTKNKQKTKTTFGAQQEEERCSGGSKKRRRFTLQEKLMYLWVVWWKVDKGLSLWEASKSINISHKQILNWKKQAEKKKSKNNQHAKSLGDGVTLLLSPYTDSLLSFIFKMRETGMAVSVNSTVLKASQLSREFRKDYHSKALSRASIHQCSWFCASDGDTLIPTSTF